MNTQKRMPVIFTGHGSPMLALDDDNITRTLNQVGQEVVRTYGKPKAILMLSAHWFTRGTFVQRTKTPRQIYDMYGFPEALYEVKYPAPGDEALADRVSELLGDDVSVNNDWGIDHGAWTVLVHMFPDADIPVVQLSIDGEAEPADLYAMAEKLKPLRDEGVLIVGSGNVVHNLRRVEWDNPGGSKQTEAFNADVVQAVVARDDEAVIHWESNPNADYAVPTPDHFLPLIMCLGAAQDENAKVFNDVCNLGAIAMTGFVLG